jgi:hypothetical protein
MIYLVATFVGSVASVISLFLFAKAVAARYRRQMGSQGEIGIRIFSPVPLAIAFVAFAAGFYAVLRISA